MAVISAVIRAKRILETAALTYSAWIISHINVKAPRHSQSCPTHIIVYT